MNEKPYIRFELPNGVRLILVPMKEVASIATSVMVAVGSRFENPQVNGASHFLEHMVFKGTDKYPTSDDVNIIERMGGIQNAYTDVDLTSYHNKVLASDWKLGLEINKELALYPRLEAKFIEKERNVILEEMKRYEDEPAAKAEETFHKMLYPGTKLGMRIIGEEASLRTVSAKTLKSHHAAWYTPDRIVIVMAGKIEQYQIASIRFQVEAWFSGKKGTTKDGIDTVSDRQRKPHLEIVTKPDASQAHLILGVRTFPRSSEDRFAWVMFNLLMGVSFTSRLFREIREKRGLCYHISSSSQHFEDAGYWYIYAGVATLRVGEAVKAILSEIAKVVARGVSEEEVSVAGKRLKTLLAFKSEDPEFLSEYYGRQVAYHLPIETIGEYFKRIDAITKDEINGLIRKYLKAATLNMALVWSKPKDNKLEQLLKL